MRATAAGRVVQFAQRLEGSLLADSPLGGLDELEDAHRPALVPATQGQTERRGRLALAVTGVNDQQRPLPPLPGGQPVRREPAPECLLASGRPTLAYGVHQLISSDLAHCQVLRAEVDAQRLGEAQRHPPGLAVDHQRGHAGAA